MSEVLARWNDLPASQAAERILPCCGSRAWAAGMANQRPISEETGLHAACDKVWWGLDESDWLEAFRAHPRIGESAAHSASARSAEWSGEEQQNAIAAQDVVKTALAEANRIYEERFHRIFIVCASGKSAQQILEILRRRLANDDAAELRESAEQQRQIIHIRLTKWLRS